MPTTESPEGQKEPEEKDGPLNSQTITRAAEDDAPAPRYALEGPQVEPPSAWWLEPKANPIRAVTLTDVLDHFKNNPAKLQSFYSKNELRDAYTELQTKWVDRRDEDIAVPLSRFLNLQSAPFGAFFNTRRTQYRVDNVLQQHRRIDRGYVVVKTGAELARLFERETPGLYHQLALQWFLYERPDVSPPRHARVWMALHIAISSALNAAWYFKWAFNVDNPAGPRISYALRPYEFRPMPGFVLYDRELNENGDGSDGPRKGPKASPGTPRHPAYPSGHSTYSKAASRVLEYFLGRPGQLDTTTDKLDPKLDRVAMDLRRLADNIGQARLYAGVHWTRDHEFGQTVGSAVADLIIAQLQRDCVPPLLDENGDIVPAIMEPPSDEQIREFRRRPCEDRRQHDNLPSREQAEDAMRQEKLPSAF